MYFIFQAEDGIRYYKVTGVQTCALPIWFALGDGPAHLGVVVGQVQLPDGTGGAQAELGDGGAERAVGLVEVVQRPVVDHQIGRASCRERGEVWVGGGSRIRQ